MVRFLRSTAACLVVLLTTIHAAGQDLPPALADQFSRGVADLKVGRSEQLALRLERTPWARLWSEGGD